MTVRDRIRRLAAQLHDEHESGYHDTPHPDCGACETERERERDNDADPRDEQDEPS